MRLDVVLEFQRLFQDANRITGEEQVKLDFLRAINENHVSCSFSHVGSEMIYLLRKRKSRHYVRM